jgi:hypothetical protein
MKTDDAYTIWCGPWRLCSTNQSHTHWQLPISKTQTASCSPWFLNDSQIDRHIDTAIQRLTLPIMYFHTDAISKKGNSSFSFTKYVHPRQLKQFLPSAIHKKKEEGPIVPPCTVLPLPNSSCLFLQQELNSTSDAAKNSQYS